MKEASGELSMTAIAVVAIAAIGIVFTTLVWPAMRAGIQRNTNCAQAFNCTCPGTDAGGMCSCEYAADDNENTIAISCPQTKVNE